MPGTSRSTGSWISPPPPTTASIQPAANAARTSTTRVVAPSEVNVVAVIAEQLLIRPERHTGRMTDGTRPLIGISTYREQARWGYWDVPAVLLPATYADAVAACGGEPVLLPTGSTSADVVARLDGLVLAGGADIDPARYGQAPGAHTTVVRPERDEAELGLLEAALERDITLLAV